MVTSGAATTQIQKSRADLEAALKPYPSLAEPVGKRLPGEGFSVLDSVTEGFDRWWHKSLVGRAVELVGPSVEAQLRPLIRSNYKVVLLGSAAVGAFVSLNPWRSTRTVLKVAGPLMLTSIALEIGKAGFRQIKRKT